MNKDNTTKFFEYLGEIRRDITSIDFLMRCAIAKYDNEINKFPKPPYTKGRIYKDPPKSFLHLNLEIIVEKFNKRFSEIKIPKEFIELRNAMAHGIIAEVNKSGIPELIKFKECEEERNIQIEFNMSLELERLEKIKESLKYTRRLIMKRIDEN